MTAVPEDPLEAEMVAGPTIEQAHFRSVVGRFASGVTVITASDGGTPVGITAQSFSSLSLDPPLILFCPAKTSSTWPRIRSAGSFCVNILGERQEDVARVFATSGADKFSGVGWHTGATGAPVLNEAMAWIDCMITAVHDAGDHEIVVGRVHDLDVQHEGHPLLFFRGGFGRFDG